MNFIRTMTIFARMVRGGARMAEELKMYTKYVDGKPYQYRYGESWRSMQLMVDGGYPTPEEAKAAWEAEQQEKQE
jgi:hypothetical protein